MTLDSAVEVGTGLIQRNKAKADVLPTVMPISVYHIHTRVYAQTLVGRLTILMGSQWAVYIATVVCIYGYKGDFDKHYEIGDYLLEKPNGD